MRTVLIGLVFAAAAFGASGQVIGPANQFELQDLRARQDAADRQAIARSNELMALDARLRADQAVGELQAQRAGAVVPSLRYEPQAYSGSSAITKYPSMPDAALADSNKRVQAAASNRR